MKTKKYIIAASLRSLTLAMTGILSLDNISVSAEKQSASTTKSKPNGLLFDFPA
ncbi:MAG: hypothetical protein IJF44_06045 [Clostridia bacterium]|nr:hypothetical protein [Clostridia bacterium]